MRLDRLAAGSYGAIGGVALDGLPKRASMFVSKDGKPPRQLDKLSKTQGMKGLANNHSTSPTYKFAVPGGEIKQMKAAEQLQKNKTMSVFNKEI